MDQECDGDGRLSTHQSGPKLRRRTGLFSLSCFSLSRGVSLSCFFFS